MRLINLVVLPEDFEWRDKWAKFPSHVIFQGESLSFVVFSTNIRPTGIVFQSDLNVREQLLEMS